MTYFSGVAPQDILQPNLFFSCQKKIKLSKNFRDILTLHSHDKSLS